MLEIKGEQFGVRIISPSDDEAIAEQDGFVVQIISEDDENWFEHGDSFHAGWLDDLIAVLYAAMNVIKSLPAPSARSDT